MIDIAFFFAIFSCEIAIHIIAIHLKIKESKKLSEKQAPPPTPPQLLRPAPKWKKNERIGVKVGHEFYREKLALWHDGVGRHMRQEGKGMRVSIMQ